MDFGKFFLAIKQNIIADTNRRTTTHEHFLCPLSSTSTVKFGNITKLNIVMQQYHVTYTTKWYSSSVCFLPQQTKTAILLIKYIHQIRRVFTCCCIAMTDYDAVVVVNLTPECQNMYPNVVYLWVTGQYAVMVNLSPPYVPSKRVPGQKQYQITRPNPH